MRNWKSRVNILQYIDDESLTYSERARYVVDALTAAQEDFDSPDFHMFLVGLRVSAECESWSSFNYFLDLVFTAGASCRIRLS